MRSAEEEKEIGNKAFAAKDYDEAINHYTVAIKLDHKNHMYYSNRSVSYLGKGKLDEAVKDAKECIRLEPTFMKGYYRLATAQTEMNDFDKALTTIKHALQLEPKNPQIVKLNRLVNAKKASSKRATSTPSVLKSKAEPLDPAVSKEVSDLRNQLRNSVRDYNVVSVEIEKLQNERVYNETTKSELGNLPDDTKAIYRRVGKMFMKSARKEINGLLEQAINDDKKTLDDLSQKKGYLERQIKSQQQNIRELTNQEN